MNKSVLLMYTVGILEGAYGFERWIKGPLGVELLSLKRLSVEGLRGGLLYWGPRKMC
jgi:hypothetical protein